MHLSVEPGLLIRELTYSIPGFNVLYVSNYVASDCLCIFADVILCCLPKYSPVRGFEAVKFDEPANCLLNFSGKLSKEHSKSGQCK